MKSTKIVVIGLGVGGFIAAKTAKKVNSSAEITIIDEKEYDMFSACGLPFAMEGIVRDFDELKHSLPTEAMGWSNCWGTEQRPLTRSREW